MTRHSRNSTANAVYTYHEKQKDSSTGGYGTTQMRLSKDAIKEFDCCNLTLQPCIDPVITKDGYLFDKQAILEYIVHQKKLNARKMREYQKQLERKQQEIDEQNANDEQKKLNKFLEKEATYSVNQSVKTLLSSKHQDQTLSSFLTTPKSLLSSSIPPTPKSTRISTNDDNHDETPATTTSSSSSNLSNMAGNQATQLPSFWIPSLTPAAKKAELKKPDQHVYCPISGKPITMKDLLDVKFKLANNVDPKKRPLVAVRDRYVCAVTGDLLGNSVPCAVLRTSSYVVTMDCINRLIKLDMIDPITGDKLTDDDIIPMQRGGTGYSGSGVQLDAKLPTPAMQ
ncbi:unnamed protein product [Rotaria sordida]|uniref:Nitric oxide synthase-interacting protein zinc-finger domain-containing protein n=1 Tax=Rotaria sordida TaxID=392033 RepID=A0A814B4L0_9BILA|nr:unnamed protein product [Rotaria sordida]CAF0931399.1 unnamed protein product [Rotaria sordida]CAF3591847.1 unnamed protein product [Rotaria sordida]CAF3795912.1 unnamed protein product [Rotaria sordida]